MVDIDLKSAKGIGSTYREPDWEREEEGGRERGRERGRAPLRACGATGWGGTEDLRDKQGKTRGQAAGRLSSGHALIPHSFIFYVALG